MADKDDGEVPQRVNENEVAILREVLRQAGNEVPPAPAPPHSQPILDAYLGQVFEGIAVVAPDGRFRLFTPGLEQITGYTAQEVGGIVDLIRKLAPDPETGAQQWAAFEQGLGHTESQEQLIQILNKRGEIRWLRGRLYRVNEDTMVHVLDITAIHNLRGATPHNAEHYHALLENLDIGVYSSSDPASGKISYNNAAARRILGVSEGAKGDLSSFMFYEDPAERVKLVSALMQGGWARSRTVRFDARLLRADDRRPVPLRFTNTATYDDEGRMVRVDGVMEDRSEHEAFEAKRREQELLVSSLFHDTAVGIAIGTMDERFLAVNKTFCAMLGYSEEELLGHGNDKVTHPDDRHITTAQIQAALARGRKSFTFRKRYVRKDGSVFTAELTMAGVNNEAGELVAGIAIVEPVDDGPQVG